MWRYPLGPPVRQPLRTISLYGRWSTSGSDRGNAHFFTATSNTIKHLGLTQVQKESYVTLCMCRLTLVWTLAKLLQSGWNADSIFFHWSGPSLMPTGLSAVPCRLPLSVLRSQLPTSQSFCPTLFSCPLTNSGHAKTLCLVSHQNRQRNRLHSGPPT